MRVSATAQGLGEKLWRDRRELLVEVARYMATSGVALALDIGLLFVATSAFHWHYLIASTISYASGVCIHYLLAIRFVFRFRRLTQKRSEFLLYLGLGLGGLIVTQTVIALAIGLLGWPLWAAKALSIGASFMTNFSLRRLVLFTPFS